METKEKVRIAYAGSATYNDLTTGSRFCNTVADCGGSHSQRGFLGGALYNENWEPSDSFCFRDFSVAGLTAGSQGGLGENVAALMEALRPAVAWKPDFLLLQVNPHLDSRAETYCAVLLAAASTIAQELPNCRLYLLGPLPAGIPKCGPVVERSCELAASFAKALGRAVSAADGLVFVDLLAALDEAEWKNLLEGVGGKELSPSAAGKMKKAQWKLGQALLFGFFEEVEQRVFPDKEATGLGEVVAVSPKAATRGLPPSCDPDQGLIRDLPEGWWQQMQEDSRRLQESGSCQLIFVGDSITHWWTKKSHIDDTYSAAGKNAFKKFFGAYESTSLNVGQASDTTADVLLRLRCGILGPKPETFNPKLVSILIGTNNIGNPNVQNQFGGPDNSRQLAQGILQVVKEVKRSCPRSRIVVTGVLPTRIPYDLTRSKLEYANYLVSCQAEQLGFTFLDMAEKMTAPDGTTMAEHYHPGEGNAARLHLCELGYEKWAAELVQFLD